MWVVSKVRIRVLDLSGVLVVKRTESCMPMIVWKPTSPCLGAHLCTSRYAFASILNSARGFAQPSVYLNFSIISRSTSGVMLSATGLSFQIRRTSLLYPLLLILSCGGLNGTMNCTIGSGLRRSFAARILPTFRMPSKEKSVSGVKGNRITRQPSLFTHSPSSL